MGKKKTDNQYASVLETHSENNNKCILNFAISLIIFRIILIMSPVFKGPLSVIYTLTVRIADVNDVIPVCSTSFYSTSVAEDVIVGTSVAQLVCTDLDAEAPNNEIQTYAITSGNEGR